MNDAGYLSKTLALARKDVLVEMRSKDTLAPMLLFACTVTVLVGFTLQGTTPLDAPIEVPLGTVAGADVVAGFLWISILFAGLIGFARTFEVEREEEAIDALLLVPIDRSGLFVAKALANLAEILVVEGVMVPLFALLFGLRLGGRWAALALVVVLVDVGFVAMGTLLAALAAHARSRELVLPILALPALVPVFLAAVELSSDLFVGDDVRDIAARGWFAILVSFDVVAVTLGALTFEYVVD